MRKLLISCRFCSVKTWSDRGGPLPRTVSYFFFLFSFLFFALSFWTHGSRGGDEIRLAASRHRHPAPATTFHTSPPQPHTPPFEFREQMGLSTEGGRN